MKGKIMFPPVDRDEAIEIFEQRHINSPRRDVAERVLKEQFTVEGVQLVYFPEYSLELESEEEKEKITVCGVSKETEIA